MSSAQIQDFLFQRIREKLPAGESLAEVVGQLLFVSADSAYRRIRGETPLVLEEARLLCEAFHISLDELLKTRKASVLFDAIQVDAYENGFLNYLQGIRSGLELLEGAPQKEMIYLTKDIPVFYNFLYPEVFAFRYFFWMKSILQHPDFVSRSFSPDVLTEEIAGLGKQITRLYARIPSTEIWNTECINSTISQIEYYREAGYFQKDEDAQAVYDGLRRLIDHLRMQAELGRKFLPGENPETYKEDFRFFYNRVVLGDNTIMTLSEGRRTLYLSYDVLNYMATADEKLCGNVYEQLQMLMRRSTLLSLASDKQRNMFFNTLLRKIPGRITNTIR